MYKCIMCGESKDECYFYKVKNTKLGHDRKCKECRKSLVRSYREDNIEKVKEYDRNRPNHKDRVEQCRVRYKKMRASGDEELLDKDRERIRKYRQENPKRYKAQCAVNNSLRDGKISRPTTCEHCGATCKPQGHHWSYEEDHWLDVIWLCTTCHANEHVRLRKEERDPDLL